MGYNLPGSSIHGIFQARVLEWGAIAFSDVSHLATPKRYKETNMGSGHFTNAFPGGTDGKRLSTM